jgi:hypothetical protein
MSQSTSLTDFPDLVDYVLNDIVEALTNRPTMTQSRRDAVATMVRTMVMGLCPRDVMQLMVAGKAVLFHALTIDAVRNLPDDDLGTLKLRAQSGVAGLDRTTTRNLEILTRLQARAAKESLARDGGRIAPEPMTEARMETLLSGLFRDESTPEVPEPLNAIETPKPPVEDTRVGPVVPLNRQQRRRIEREQARLAPRMPANQPAMRDGRQ